jgi:putative transposase
MRSDLQCTPGKSKVYGFVGALLRRHLELRDFGRTCHVGTLLAVLLFAAARRLSISRAAQELRGAPSDETVRKALAKQLPSMRELEDCLNAALCDHLPRDVRRGRRMWAIDLHEQPYYGRPAKADRELRGGQAKQGTRWFHTIATLYLVHRGERFTLAMTYVWGDDSLIDVLARLIARVRGKRISPKYLLLDRQFYSVEVVQFLQAHRLPFLMPVAHRGRRAKDPAKSPSTQRFLVCRRSRFDTHQMRRHDRTATVCIAVAVDHPPPRKRRRRGPPPAARCRVLVFAFWGVQFRSPAAVREAYRRRFGIESSYRQMREGQARTTTRRTDQRLLLMGIALLLRNAWVWLHRQLISRPLPHGAFQLHPERLRLPTLLIHLAHEVILLLGLTEFPLPLPDTGHSITDRDKVWNY